jgi:NAD(P)-dependent dehydrogenase (short-subunit alcohol dehydrogenase family)
MIKEKFDLTGRTAVILGGSGGIGSRIIEGLLELGARVFSGDRNPGMSSSASLTFITTDAASESSLAGFRDQVLAKAGQIDILVDCVGGNLKEATTDPEHSFFDLDTEALRKIINLNLFAGAILPAKVFGKVMASNPEGGSILFISSMTADRPLTRVPGYSAAKAAVENFTKWLACDMAKNHNPNIRVNSLAPGFFQTRQNDFLLLTPDKKLTPRGQDIIVHTPMGRFGDLDELTGTALWLCSDLSKFVTGITVPVDGGFSAFAGV